MEKKTTMPSKTRTTGQDAKTYGGKPFCIHRWMPRGETGSGNAVGMVLNDEHYTATKGMSLTDFIAHTNSHYNNAGNDPSDESDQKSETNPWTVAAHASNAE